MTLRFPYPSALIALVVGVCALQAADGPALSFRRQTIDAKIQIGYGLAIADVDGDGRNDILLADAKEIVWYRNPGWEKCVMAANLTPKDNVCIAARDIDGDGKAEVAVGAEWNPSDTVNSGAVFFLERPSDPTQLWRPIRLPHEPTTHRMHWIKNGEGGWALAVLPLHGRGNKAGQGDGIQFLGYQRPHDSDSPWATIKYNGDLHLAHNFEPPTAEGTFGNTLWAAAKEGVQALTIKDGTWSTRTVTQMPAGEVRGGRASGGGFFLTTIEPMHGNQLAVYSVGSSSTTAANEEPQRILVDDTLVDGHALATGDLLGLGYDQIVAGWRGAAARPGQKVGIKLFVAAEPPAQGWSLRGLIDDNEMACEDLKLADLNGDGRLDVIASGRATKNVVIYWNETPAAK